MAGPADRGGGIRIKGADAGGGENVNEFGRGHSEKLQQHGKNILSAFYMLIRSVKLYDPENVIFQKPLDLLNTTINLVVAGEGRCEIQAVKESFYVNAMLVKVDLSSLDNVRYLCSELQRLDVGGFTVTRPTSVNELRQFVGIFRKDQDQQPDEDGLGGNKLANVRITKYSKIKEKLDSEPEKSDDEKVDRKKYALTVYARGIFFLAKYFEELKAGKTLGQGKINRVIQDLVDISYEQKSHFLGMTSMRREDDYLVYHSINTALMCIVFGSELGLKKPQLRELGNIALFHDAGLAMLPQALLEKKGALTPDEKKEIAKAPLRTVQAILREKGVNRSAIMRVVTTHEHKTEFGTAVRNSRGAIQMIIPKANLGIFARVLSICCVYDSLTSKRPYRDAYGPEIALTLMWTEMRHKFDPELLKVFMKVMAIQPIRVMPKGKKTVSIG